MTIPAYPLQWPDGWKRTAPADRRSAKFSKQKVTCGSYVDYEGKTRSTKNTSHRSLSINDATTRVRQAIRAMTADDDFVLNSNLQLRLDGMPRSGQSEPADPGVVIYWRDSKVDGWPQRCMAIDIYDRVADNIAAIAATLDAMRAIERHGGAEILNRAFTGFVALEHQSENWRSVLGVGANATRAEIESAYRSLRSKHHPDRGGDPEQFQRVLRAYEQGRNDEHKKIN